MIDNENIYWTVGRLQLESKLLLQSRKQRRCGCAGRGNIIAGQPREGQREIEAARELQCDR